MHYEPKPLRTDATPLPPALNDLIDQLARHIHEVWAAQRMGDGWRHGPKRSDAGREHPLLVPFAQLPEQQRSENRRVAEETLKAMLILGYEVDIGSQPTRGAATRPIGGPGFLGDVTRLDMDTLTAIWRGRQDSEHSWNLEFYKFFGDRLISAGEPLLAYDVISEGLALFPRDVRLRQLQMLGLARIGATERANRLAADMIEAGHVDEETLGVLARTHKDLWQRTRGANERGRHLEAAFAAYKDAYEKTSGYWTGINVATIAVLLGRREEAVVVARRIHQQCLDELVRLKNVRHSDRYWPMATLGEAALITGDIGEAEHWYDEAAELGSGRFGDLSTTRRNARLLLEHCGGDTERIERCFRIPRVVLFAGHLMDGPHRGEARFPASSEGRVKDAIREYVTRVNGIFAYSSAACGSDILFLEVMGELNGESHVVLPFERDQFVAESVEVVPGADWSARFDAVMGHASGITTASPHRLARGDLSFAFANTLLLGLAQMRTRQLDTELVAVAVWDGGSSMTGDTVAHWRSQGLPVHVIGPREATSRATQQAIAVPRAADRDGAGESKTDYTTRIMAILFADAVKFSHLTEEQIPIFVKHFAGAIAGLCEESDYGPIYRNSWGDGLFFVFESVLDAGRFALDLRDCVSRDWSKMGLPAALDLRVALHAGPVYACEDPITRQWNYLGSHVSRAARIEPITPPGHVYASQAFAAIATAEGIEAFSCDYVGRTPLAKGYGTFPTYHVRRATG